MKERGSNSQGVMLRTEIEIHNEDQFCVFIQAVSHRRPVSTMLESKHISNKPTELLFAYIRLIFAQRIWMNYSL